MNGKLATFGSRISALVGAAGVAAAAASLASFAKQSFEAADALGDAADRAGVAVESLSRLKFAAEQSDVNFEALTLSLKRWQVTLSQAASGSTDAGNALKLLHLNASQLKSLSLEDQLKTIADQFARIRDPADQTRVAVELFGRAGEQLVPLLKQGGGAIAQLTAEADRLGITLDSRTTKSVDAADKALKRFLATISSAGQRTAGSLALAIVGPTDQLDAAFLKLEQLKKQRDELLNPSTLTKIFVPEGPRNRAVENLNRQIDQQLRALNALQRAQEDTKPPPLTIPDDSPITEVLIRQRKTELEGLAKLLDDFEKSTRTTEDKIYQDYRDTVNKIQELVDSGVIDADQAVKRLRDARTKYEDDSQIELIDVNAIERQRVVVTKVLSQQERAVDKFVGTVQTGLTNLAMSGELTGRSILKYLVSSFEAQILKDAIDGLARYLRKSLNDALDGSGGSGVGFVGSLLGGLFGSGGGSKLSGSSGVGALTGSTRGYAAGGGSMSGPRWVGEDGPELDTGGSNIMNRRQLAFAMAGGGGTQIQMGDTHIVVQGNADASVLQAMEVRLAQRDQKLLERMNVKLKETFGRAPR